MSSAQWKIDNVDKMRKYRREWYARNRSDQSTHTREYRRDNPDKVRQWRLGAYGLTTTEYDVLLLKQDGLCAICRKPDNKRLAVDHDHITGEVRGLLCSGCNLGIGGLKDSIEHLQAAILYLQKSV